MFSNAVGFNDVVYICHSLTETEALWDLMGSNKLLGVPRFMSLSLR